MPCPVDYLPMKTYTNTKKIPAKLFYDVLKSNFKEMFASRTLQYGINQNTVSVEDSGTEIYRIEITDELIQLTAADEMEKKVGNKLDEFIQAALQ